LGQKAKKQRLNLLSQIRGLIAKNKYRLVPHAIERQLQRSVSLRDTLFVLMHGSHEEEKDSFDIKRQQWRYAVRGKTPDDVDVRVVVTIENMVIVITVIKPGK
jgi:hypothetical protein